MKIFKFGGASVKDAQAVQNLASIVRQTELPLVIVVSAMGKITNALEGVLLKYFEQHNGLNDELTKIYEFHINIIRELFPQNHKTFTEFEQHFNLLRNKLNTEPSITYNFEYDQIVSYGEILSTCIVNAFLNYTGINSEWKDIRKYLKTDTNYREASINFEQSELLIKKAFTKEDCCITQGFLGSTANNLTTTLGREGSDYTAALLAYFLNAESVTVWKDVPGVLNADPKWFDDTIKLDKLSYFDAIELAYYGASVIHPKTIQPLKRKNIPLWVRSFLEPTATGTYIGELTENTTVPCFIFKVNQVLIDIYPFDYSFIAEENLQYIFSVLARHSFRINLMQNSAVSFRICVNYDTSRIKAVIGELENKYQIITAQGLELITIRHYNQEAIDRTSKCKKIILEQKSETTIQMVVENVPYQQVI